MARGRARRRHRLSAVAGLSVAGAAAGAVLALGLTGVLGPARAPGTIRTTAFTLASNSNGTATLTINPVHPTITIDPAAMPAGTELSFGDFRLTSGQQQASFALIDTSSYTCTSSPPGPTGPPDGSQLLYGGPGPAGS